MLITDNGITDIFNSFQNSILLFYNENIFHYGNVIHIVLL